MTETSTPQVATAQATGELMSLAYEELRSLARRYFRDERSGHTLQPTALVHEAYLRLIDQRQLDWENRNHFLANAARMMRRVLITHAVARTRQKRGGVDSVKVSLDEVLDFYDARKIDLVAMDQALQELEELDFRQAQIVELRFFGGLTVEEIATFLGISPRTVKREWSTARHWLRRELSAA